MVARSWASSLSLTVPSLLSEIASGCVKSCAVTTPCEQDPKCNGINVMTSLLWWLHSTTMQPCGRLMVCVLHAGCSHEIASANCTAASEGTIGWHFVVEWGLQEPVQAEGTVQPECVGSSEHAAVYCQRCCVTFGQPALVNADAHPVSAEQRSHCYSVTWPHRQATCKFCFAFACKRGLRRTFEARLSTRKWCLLNTHLAYINRSQSIFALFTPVAVQAGRLQAAQQQCAGCLVPPLATLGSTMFSAQGC